MLDRKAIQGFLKANRSPWNVQAAKHARTLKFPLWPESSFHALDLADQALDRRGLKLPLHPNVQRQARVAVDRLNYHLSQGDPERVNQALGQHAPQDSEDPKEWVSGLLANLAVPVAGLEAKQA